MNTQIKKFRHAGCKGSEKTCQFNRDDVAIQEVAERSSVKFACNAKVLIN